MSLNSPNVVIINLSTQLASSGYCYVINANNGTFTTQIEGMFGKCVCINRFCVHVCVCMCVCVHVCVRERQREMIKISTASSDTDTNKGQRNTNVALAIGIIVPLLIFTIVTIAVILIVIIWKPWKRRRKTITSASRLTICSFKLIASNKFFL